VNRYAAALSRHPLPTQAVGEVAGEVLEQLDGESPDLVVVFCSPHLAGAAEDVADTLVELLRPAALLGAAMAAVIGDGAEVEDEPALAVWAASLPGTAIRPLELRVEEAGATAALVGWPDSPDGSEARDPSGAPGAPGGSEPAAGTPGPTTLLLLADPFTFPVEAVLESLGAARPDVQVVGGLASAADGPGGNRLLLGRGAVTQGAVGVLLQGGAGVEAVVAQGCRTIGQPLTVTGADGRYLTGLGGRSALERLQEAVTALPPDQQEAAVRGLHVGIVAEEHRGEPRPGDFLVRNLVGARPEDGALAIGTPVEIGRVVQFMVRDPLAADRDLDDVLAGRDGAAALLFTCTGRGRRLFGVPDHDAAAVAAALGPVPVAGAFCAGEIGPVAGRNHVHGFSASLALFPASPEGAGRAGGGT
jgi:small ligand-binding sensory domain FIST